MQEIPICTKLPQPARSQEVLTDLLEHSHVSEQVEMPESLVLNELSPPGGEPIPLTHGPETSGWIAERLQPISTGAVDLDWEWHLQELAAFVDGLLVALRLLQHGLVNRHNRVQLRDCDVKALASFVYEHLTRRKVDVGGVCVDLHPPSYTRPLLFTSERDTHLGPRGSPPEPRDVSLLRLPQDVSRPAYLQLPRQRLERPAVQLRILVEHPQPLRILLYPKPQSVREGLFLVLLPAGPGHERRRPPDDVELLRPYVIAAQHLHDAGANSGSCRLPQNGKWAGKEVIQAMLKPTLSDVLTKRPLESVDICDALPFMRLMPRIFEDDQLDLGEALFNHAMPLPKRNGLGVASCAIEDKQSRLCSAVVLVRWNPSGLWQRFELVLYRSLDTFLLDELGCLLRCWAHAAYCPHRQHSPLTATGPFSVGLRIYAAWRSCMRRARGINSSSALGVNVWCPCSRLRRLCSLRSLCPGTGHLSLQLLLSLPRCSQGPGQGLGLELSLQGPGLSSLPGVHRVFHLGDCLVPGLGGQ
mmetsp:Transcript_85966/g.208269  ORF Transcript_85966/g.208269 Transcript_85966/m.208269 type:complete len:528 (+) Transcript_85966:79-1662(+)